MSKMIYKQSTFKSTITRVYPAQVFWYGDGQAPLWSPPHRRNYSHVDAAHVVAWLNGDDWPVRINPDAVELPGYEQQPDGTVRRVPIMRPTTQRVAVRKPPTPRNVREAMRRKPK